MSRYLSKILSVADSSSTTRGLYNVDVLWAKILDVMPEAQSARLMRVLLATASEASWRRLWSQAVNAGRVITRALRS